VAMALQFLSALIQPACRTSGGIRVPRAVMGFILDSCVNEHPEIRRLAVPLLVSLCTLYKPLLERQPLDGVENVYHKSWQGYYTAAPPALTLTSPVDVICAPSAVSKDEFCELIVQHFFSDKGSALLAGLFADLRGVKQTFDVDVAQLFKSLYQIIGLEFMNLVQPQLQEHLEGILKDPAGDPSQGGLAGFPESLAGLIRVLKYHDDYDQQLAWDFVENTLQQLTPASKMEGAFLQGCLNFCTYNLHPDVTKRFRKFWTDRLDLTKDRTGSLQLLALSFLDLSGLWRAPTELHALAQLVMGQFDHSYGQLRGCTALIISDTFTRASRPVQGPSGSAILAAPKPDETLMRFHQTIIEFYRGRQRAATREVASSINSSFAMWYARQAELSIFVEPYAIAYLDHLTELFDAAGDAEAFATLHHALLRVGKGLFCAETVQQLWAWLHMKVANSQANWRCLTSLLSLLQLVLYTKQFYLTPESVSAAAQDVAELLKHPTAEVRESARVAISIFAKASEEDCIEGLIKKFQAWGEIPRRDSVTRTTESSRLRNAGCLGLAGILQAFPFTVPPCVPAVLCALARHADAGAETGATVRRAFAEWWKTHSDEWEFGFKELFTEDECEVITNLMYSPMYYS